MLEWFKGMRQRLPAEYVGFVDFLLLTGLRPDEGCHAINILKKSGSEGYLNKERMILEHFKYPSIFIRRTKKAYVSVVSEPLLSAVKATEKGVIPDSYYDFYHKLYSKIVKNTSRVPYRGYGKKLPMNNCRKIYGTWLRMNGIESEVIDLVQGRTASSVFAKHYFRPDFDETCEKIRILTGQLYAKIN